MTVKQQLATIVAVLALMAGGCGSTIIDSPADDAEAGGSPAESPEAAQETEPPYGAWVLTQSEPEVGEPDGVRSRMAVLKESGQLLARTDTPCNAGGGRLSVEGTTWRIDEFAQTSMECEQASQEAERTFHASFTAATTWQLDGDRLALRGPDVLLVFERMRSGG